jgi:hypothetical protein
MAPASSSVFASRAGFSAHGAISFANLGIGPRMPDADGTLGGLARQGESANIVRVFEDALSSMTWCSSDPLCIEGVHGRSEPAKHPAKS